MALLDIKEQETITQLLLGSIENNRVSHAYIFAGAKGVGKKQVALEFAKALNCLSDQTDGCGSCSNCKKIEHSNHQDVVWLKPDGNTIKIDQIRQLQRDSNLKSVGSKYKVFIIEQAELMTIQAANSLLKFLEEPTSPSVAILIVENQHQLLPTIKSRAQIIYFPHLDINSIVEILVRDGIKESDALIAASLTSNLEEVKNLVSSESFAQMRNQVIQWSEDIYSKKYNALLSINDKILKNDYIKEYLPLFLDLLVVLYRDILNIRLNRSFIIFQEYEHILNKQALQTSAETIVFHIETILETKKQIQAHVNPQLALEHMVLTLWEG